MPDDNGKGRAECWRVQNRELVVVRDEMWAMFFEKNCYVIKYTPLNKRGGVVYFWQVRSSEKRISIEMTFRYRKQGKNASTLDKGASALHTVTIAEKMSGGSVQILVNQGYEPRHFLKIFKGKFIILFGTHEEFLKNKDEGVVPSGNRLFKIRGTTDENVHAEQLKAVAASLASDDSFILATPTETYVWNGVVCAFAS